MLGLCWVQWGFYSSTGPCAFKFIVSDIEDQDQEENWPQHHSLRNSANNFCLGGLNPIAGYNLVSVTEEFCDPVSKLSTYTKASQLMKKNSMVNFVKSLAKIEINGINTRGSSF